LREIGAILAGYAGDESSFHAKAHSLGRHSYAHIHPTDGLFDLRLLPWPGIGKIKSWQWGLPCVEARRVNAPEMSILSLSKCHLGRVYAPTQDSRNPHAGAVFSRRP